MPPVRRPLGKSLVLLNFVGFRVADPVIDITEVREARRQGGPPIDGKFIRKCLANNERGDGVLFATLHRDAFIFNKATGAWLKYTGHHWDLDHFNEAFSGVEPVAVKYLDEAEKLTPLVDDARDKFQAAKATQKRADKAYHAAQKTEEGVTKAKADLVEADLSLEKAEAHFDSIEAEHKAFMRRVERLRSVRGAQNCLTWSHCIEQPLACKGDEFDRQPWLLPCDNGVIDLRTGKLRPGHPSDMLMRAIQVDWPADFPGLDAYLRCEPGAASPCPEWERFFAEIHQNDLEIVDFHGRYLGYTATGLTHEQYYLCWVGDGANGKGVMGDILAEILGPLAWDISPELILEQKNSRGSSGPSADLVSLMGRRLVIASEPDENRRISAAMIKRLTGQERITARSPHDKYEITFEPAFKLIFRTNNVPHGLTKDFAMVRRLIYIHFPLMYVEEPESEAASKPQQAHLFRRKDGGLRDRLRKEKPGILAWLVRECLKYRRDGLSPPDKIRAAVEDLRRQEDHLGRFIEECCERTDPGDWIMFKEFYGTFKKWYEDNVDDRKGGEKYFPSKKSCSAQLVKKGFERQQHGGQTYIYGLRIPFAPE